jgi:glyoxylase-like metal-dependent hydrolase (beta-lactamase superfamily II)
MRSALSCIVLLAFGLTLPLGAQDFETTEIAKGVYQFRWVGHNGMFVVGGDEVVAIDPINSEAAGVFALEIRRVAPGARLAAIVYSHSDADHTTGAPALMAGLGVSDVPIIAQEHAVAPIRERGDPEQPEPTLTFAERLSFAVGDRRIELHYLGPSHTDNLAVAFVPDAGVAFAVDFVSNDRVGYQGLPGWRFPEFFDALADMLRIPFETVVFGHGPPGDRGSIRRQIAYYDALTSTVRRGVAEGLSEDEVAERIELPDFAYFGQFEAWMPLNARALYRWIVGGG